MLTTMFMSDVAWDTCQWSPVAEDVAGIRVKSITKFLTDRKLKKEGYEKRMNINESLEWTHKLF